MQLVSRVGLTVARKETKAKARLQIARNQKPESPCSSVGVKDHQPKICSYSRAAASYFTFCAD